MKLTVYLKGHLQWYDKEKRREINLEVSETDLTPRKVLQMLNVPLNQVQFVSINEVQEKDMDKILKDGDTMHVIPVIEGG